VILKRIEAIAGHNEEALSCRLSAATLPKNSTATSMCKDVNVRKGTTLVVPEATTETLGFSPCGTSTKIDRTQTDTLPEGFDGAAKTKQIDLLAAPSSSRRLDSLRWLRAIGSAAALALAGVLALAALVAGGAAAGALATVLAWPA
jgi:hypothetical protein